MSRMADLDTKLRAAGIDPERVDLERANRYREKYQAETGGEISLFWVVGILYWMDRVGESHRGGDGL